LNLKLVRRRSDGAEVIGGGIGKRGDAGAGVEVATDRVDADSAVARARGGVGASSNRRVQYAGTRGVETFRHLTGPVGDGGETRSDLGRVRHGVVAEPLEGDNGHFRIR